LGPHENYENLNKFVSASLGSNVFRNVFKTANAFSA